MEVLGVKAARTAELTRGTKGVGHKIQGERSPGRKATGIGVCDPSVRLQPLHRLTPSFSSV